MVREVISTREPRITHIFFWEEEGRLTDAPVDSVQFSRLPDAPKDMQVAKIDVVIRLRRR